MTHNTIGAGDCHALPVDSNATFLHSLRFRLVLLPPNSSNPRRWWGSCDRRPLSTLLARAGSPRERGRQLKHGGGDRKCTWWRSREFSDLVKHRHVCVQRLVVHGHTCVRVLDGHGQTHELTQTHTFYPRSESHTRTFSRTCDGHFAISLCYLIVSFGDQCVASWHQHRCLALYS
jgi:hypothetical protein